MLPNCVPVSIHRRSALWALAHNRFIVIDGVTTHRSILSLGEYQETNQANHHARDSEPVCQVEKVLVTSLTGFRFPILTLPLSEHSCHSEPGKRLRR